MGGSEKYRHPGSTSEQLNQDLWRWGEGIHNFQMNTDNFRAVLSLQKD
jgi:hypothetical protein